MYVCTIKTNNVNRSLIRRIIGITALVLMVMYFVLKFSFGEGIRVIGQLDNWGLLIASLLGIAWLIMINIDIVEEGKSDKREKEFCIPTTPFTR